MNERGGHVQEAATCPYCWRLALLLGQQRSCGPLPGRSGAVCSKTCSDNSLGLISHVHKRLHSLHSSGAAVTALWCPCAGGLQARRPSCTHPSRPYPTPRHTSA